MFCIQLAFSVYTIVELYPAGISNGMIVGIVICDVLPLIATLGLWSVLFVQFYLRVVLKQTTNEYLYKKWQRIEQKKMDLESERIESRRLELEKEKEELRKEWIEKREKEEQMYNAKKKATMTLMSDDVKLENKNLDIELQ